jgi:Domain of unknown function (DUF4384)
VLNLVLTDFIIIFKQTSEKRSDSMKTKLIMSAMSLILLITCALAGTIFAADDDRAIGDKKELIVNVSFVASAGELGPFPGKKVGDPATNILKIEPGTTLRSGDKIKIFFSSNMDCYVYIFQYGSTGLASTIFPNKQIAMSNKINGTDKYSIPPGEQWFFLDKNSGKESLYLIASVEPVKDLDALAEQLKNSPQLRAKLSKTLEAEINEIYASRDLGDALAPIDSTGTAACTERNIGGVTTGPEMTVQTNTSTRATIKPTVLKGEGVVARHVEFMHVKGKTGTRAVD